MWKAFVEQRDLKYTNADFKISLYILIYKKYLKKTWTVMKDAIGKIRSTQSSVPKKSYLRWKLLQMYTSFPNILILIVQKLVQTLQIKSKNYLLILKAIIKNAAVFSQNIDLSINELKDEIFSLGINKSPDFDSISFTPLIVLLSFINHCYRYPNYI